MYSDIAIIIPARLGAQRLPSKPLKLIGNFTMIEHVVKQVQKTGLDNIYVATDSELIAEKVTNCGGKYIMTSENLLSGTERVYQAFQSLPNNSSINYVLNVQGDMPFLEPKVIIEVIDSLKKSNHEIITPVIKVNTKEAEGASNVKVVVDANNKALYFSRNLIPYNATEFLYHVGVYGFKAAALAKFVKLSPSYLEKTEQLEQLRALENGMEIGVCYVDNIPISVDTIDDLNKAIEFYNNFRK